MLLTVPDIDRPLVLCTFFAFGRCVDENREVDGEVVLRLDKSGTILTVTFMDKMLRAWLAC